MLYFGQLWITSHEHMQGQYVGNYSLVYESKCHRKEREWWFWDGNLKTFWIQMQQDLLKFSSSKKKVTTSVISTSKSFWSSNFVILVLWTSRDHTSDFLSSSQLVGCLLSVAAHTSTTKIPQVQPQHHHMVFFISWTETKNKTSGCDLLHFIISFCSKILGAPIIQ
jgi:hypothetical protein